MGGLDESTDQSVKDWKAGEKTSTNKFNGFICLLPNNFESFSFTALKQLWGEGNHQGAGYNKKNQTHECPGTPKRPILAISVVFIDRCCCYHAA